MACGYCHNSQLVLNPDINPLISEDYFFDFLSKRSSILQGVCISGGEPTLSADLLPFVKKIKTMGLKVKLDTNGLRPHIISSLLEENLLDMIAMDIKAPLDSYSNITRIKNIDTSLIEESAKQLLESTSLSYEFRMTVPSQLFNEEDMKKIGSWLKGARAYYLQAFRNSDSCMEKGYREPSLDELLSLQKVLKDYIPNTFIRGVDA